jgi:hypothetical protein
MTVEDADDNDDDRGAVKQETAVKTEATPAEGACVFAREDSVGTRRGAEIDPLDAFMADLEAKVPNASARGLFIDSLPVSAEDSAKREERKGPRAQEALAMAMTGATRCFWRRPHARAAVSDQDAADKKDIKHERHFGDEEEVMRARCDDRPARHVCGAPAQLDEEDWIKGEEEMSWLQRQEAAKGKKELKKVDHKKMTYPAFRKKFYMEAKEIADMTCARRAVLRSLSLSLSRTHTYTHCAGRRRSKSTASRAWKASRSAAKSAPSR